MRFYNDASLQSPEVQRRWGRYVLTFESGPAGVRADLFEQGTGLVAYLRGPRGFDEGDTSEWQRPLRAKAAELGYPGDRLKMVQFS